MRVFVWCSACVFCGLLCVLLGYESRSKAASDILNPTVAAADELGMQAASPGWSRGQQNLALSYDECVRRMPLALEAEGYRRDDAGGGNFAAGMKAPHTAVIICSPAPENKMLVQIVVASNGDGGGRDRQCLQAQMERLGSYPDCRSSGNSGGPGTGSLMWKPVGTGDCSGGDQGESNGTVPDIAHLQPGFIAVCWDGRKYNNTYASNSGRAFCTYKKLPPDQCRGGSNIGQMWQAVPR